MMTDSKAKRAPRVSAASKSAAKATKVMSAGTQTKGRTKSGAKLTSGPGKAKSLKLVAGGNRKTTKADDDAPAVVASTKSRKKSTGKPASEFIEQQNRNAGDWRAKTLGRMRALILEADPEIIEEQKWRKPSNGMVGVPVWSLNGIVCTGETYTKVVKLTFAQGASVPDPSRLFNSSLEGNTRRAIDIHEGEQVNAGAFKTLVKAAVAHNGSPAKKAKSGAITTKPGAKVAKPIKVPKGQKGDVVLLSGGNPQIAKADGDAPVQVYIAAMPGWKHDVGLWLDSVIERNVPNVRKAVKWNTPFYGIEGQGWFLGFHCITKYVKVAFFRGTSLDPLPPGESTQKEVRYLHIHEGDLLDDAQMATWVKQAAALPGWVP